MEALQNQEMKRKEINYSFEYAPTLYNFYKCDKRIVAVRGARGSGKSSACVMKLLKNGLNQAPDPQDGIRRSRWAIIRNTNAQLQDSSIRKVFEWLPEEYFGTYNKTQKNYLITKFPNTVIEFSFRALDEPKDVRNLLSLELSGAWINEAREIHKAIFDNLDASLGRYPGVKDGGCTLPQIILDTNSPEEDSWWFKYFEVDRPASNRMQEISEQFVQPSARSEYAENVPFLIPGYYENLIHGKDEEWIKVYIDNEYGFVKEGDLIFESTWTDRLHVARDMLHPVKDRLVVLSFDFGLTPAASFMQINPMGHFNVLDELVSDSMGIKRFANNILKPLMATRYAGCKFFITGDPSGRVRVQTDEKTCYEELRDAFPGHQIQEASTNSPIARIGAIEYFLTQPYSSGGTPCFQLSPTCKVLRKAFNKGYVKDSLGKPKKNQWSHIMDSLGYGALYFYQMIKKVEKTNRFSRRRSRYRPPTHAGI